MTPGATSVAAGVAATYLNSTLSAAEARSRLAGLHRNEWRLLYVAPERLLELDAALGETPLGPADRRLATELV